MNTVGKKGRLGERVRCVVSVSMLTEGCDANTVTHILGIRAFGSQLLCEQVVGRGLRRRSYEPNTHGTFDPQYADVDDPTTGVVRSDGTEKVALWMIDTDYDGDSFYVRHCYFTGGQDPYKRLKSTLKSEIDPDAWATLYRTESRPFPPPAKDRIAVKVINDYGDEVMTVYEVPKP